MRSAAIFLALLLCLQWAQGESGGEMRNETTPPDIWAELKELRDMTIEHRLHIEKLQEDNTATQARLTTIESNNEALEARMSSSETVIKELQTANTALEGKISASNGMVEELKKENTVLEARMNASENAVAELQKQNKDLLTRVTATEDKNKVLETRVSSSETEVTELVKETEVLETRMSTNENEVEELVKENETRPKVAFSVGLTDVGSVGPFATDIVLKFSKVFTNIGQGYNPATGVFTTPVKGAYYFRFNGWNSLSTTFVGISLYHNNRRLTTGADANDNIGFVSVSNGLVVQLEKGDLVYMVQNAGFYLYDDAFNRTTFSGFYLFDV